MSASGSLSRCPICMDNYLESSTISEKRIANHYLCRRCGKFISDELIIQDPNLDKVRPLVSAWIRQQNKGGRVPVLPDDIEVPPSKWFQNLEHFGFPQTVNEKMDALLNSYADIVKNQFRKPIKIQPNPQLISDIAAKDIHEVRALSELLYERGYIDLTSDDIVKVRVNGWDRIDEIRKSVSSSNSAFIAMWYDQCTDKYRDATLAAVSHCGYRPLIVDQPQFNGFIMDQVTSLIRQSRFVVADFTCRPEGHHGTNEVINGVRGGVYWEAGFAYGIGRTVIHTCEDTDEARRRLHFDVQQYKTIFWKSDELDTNVRDLLSNVQNPNFAERLAMNILAIVGQGSSSQAQ
jgi:hypothetical protein